MLRASLLAAVAITFALPAQALVVRKIDKEFDAQFEAVNTKDNAATLRILNAWMDSKPDTQEILYIICARSGALGDEALAIRSCIATGDISANTNNAKDAQFGYYNAGIAYLAQKDNAAAIEFCSKAQSVYTPLRQGYGCIAQANLRDDLMRLSKEAHPHPDAATRQRLLNAIEAYKQALPLPVVENNLRDDGVWFNLANIYWTGLDDLPNAKAAAEKAAALNPNYPSVWQVLGTIYWQLHMKKEAHAARAQAQKYDPEQAKALDVLFKAVR